jgi:predicted MFS family arabinose efflux permease
MPFESAAAAPAPAGRRPQSELAEHWPLALSASIGVLLSFASVFIYSFSVFLKPLASEFGWSRAQISGGFSLAALTVAFASPFLGRLADRSGVRTVIAASSALFGLAFSSLALLTPRLWHFYAVLFLIGLIGNATTQLTWAKAIASTFRNQRGVALSLMMVGVGIGSMLVPWSAARIAGTLGWRAAYGLLGGAVLLAGPLLALLSLRGHAQPATRPRATARSGGRRFPPVFVRLLAAFFLVSLGANGCLAHLVALLTDRGYSAADASTVAAVLGLASVAGRLGTGPLIDRFFAPRVGFVFVAASAAGFAMLAFHSSRSGAYAAAALIGLAMGAESDFFPYLISRYMGMESFTELYGYAFSAYAVAGAAGPLLMGLAFDHLHSYTPGIAVGALATLAAAALLVTLPHYRPVPS